MAAARAWSCARQLAGRRHHRRAGGHAEEDLHTGCAAPLSVRTARTSARPCCRALSAPSPASIADGATTRPAQAADAYTSRSVRRVVAGGERRRHLAGHRTARRQRRGVGLDLAVRTRRRRQDDEIGPHRIGRPGRDVVALQARERLAPRGVGGQSSPHRRGRPAAAAGCWRAPGWRRARRPAPAARSAP